LPKPRPARRPVGAAKSAVTVASAVSGPTGGVTVAARANRPGNWHGRCMIPVSYGAPPCNKKGRANIMSIAKVTEISASSPTGFEDAISKGVQRASKTIHGMRSAWVNEQSVVIDNERVTEWRVNLKVTFVIDD
jgi:dodecin